MKLILISPEDDDPKEFSELIWLFEEGLSQYHLRKPNWDRAKLANWLEALPARYHKRIVLHTHYDLIYDFGIGGVHERDISTAQHKSVFETIDGVTKSRSVHNLESLKDLAGKYDRLLFSPVFPSISKPGHEPAYSQATIAQELIKVVGSEIIALGGVTCDRIGQCADLGFDGVAVLGAVWHSTDPVRAFLELREKCEFEYAE